jgi:hypothetical protein
VSHLSYFKIINIITKKQTDSLRTKTMSHSQLAIAKRPAIN